MNRFVLDASVSLGWLLADEDNAEARRILLLLRDAEGYAPAIWPLEVANALLAAQRRKRITRPEVRQALELLAELGIRLEAVSMAEASRLWVLAQDHRLSVYDAAYLDLALREHVPLATLDGDLRRAATALGVELLIP